MARKHARLVQGGPEVEAYSRQLMERAAQVRLPELFQSRHRQALYHVVDRNGVSTVVLRRSALRDEQLVELLRYRLGQYVHPSISIIDPRLVYESRMEHEPLENEAAGDIHFIAGSPATGEVLCYAVLRALPEPAPRKTLRHRSRPFFPVEKVHGWGVFNRLEILPDLPVDEIRELGRFVKNHLLHALNEPSARAPVEIGTAVFRMLTGPLCDEVKGFVGDLEEGIAKKTLDFFHIPTVLIRGVVPYSPEASYFFPRNQYCTVYPFASLVEDLQGSVGRLEELEAVLRLPGKEGLLGLFDLKRTSRAIRSSLEPAGGLYGLSATELPDQGGAMRIRAGMLETARHLRAFDPFSALSDSEMRILSSFMERRRVPAGQAIVKQGDQGDDLFLIEEGEALVSMRTGTAEPETVAVLSSGHYFGEIALLQGGVRTADVVALTDMEVLRLSKDAYQRFLARLSEVEQRIARTAARRSTENEQRSGIIRPGAATGFLPARAARES
jgi:CRP-like cAMP-binding protein